MRAMGRPTEGKSRKVTPPSPSYMTNDQFSKYLSELRSNRIARPGGARPQPAGARPAPSRYSTGRPSIDASSQAETLPEQPGALSRAPSAIGSISSRHSYSSVPTRDYYPSQPSVPLKPSEVVPSATYIERGHRWMEKEEAHSLRDAMEEMQLRETPKEEETPDDETRIYNAALDEAAELVWQHRNGVPPPQPNAPYRYKPHLRKNSYAHARTASTGKYGQDAKASGLTREASSRSVSGSSTESDGASQRIQSTNAKPVVAEPTRNPPKSYGSVGARRTNPFSRRRSSLKRNISGEVARPFSGDQIWEEPESNAGNGGAKTGELPETLSNTTQNPLNRVRFESPRHELSSTKSLDRIEIYRNPPTRSRNPQYTTNSSSSQPPIDDQAHRKNGVEVRGQDIREATSMKLKDRSSKLPEPTAVSDSPGRPIVSFDTNWKSPDESTDKHPDRVAFNSSNKIQPPSQPMGIPSITVAEDDTPSSHADIPSISIAGPEEPASGGVPIINVPTIAIDEAPSNGNSNSANIPVIVTPGDESTTSARPLPTPGARGNNFRKAQKPKGHWSPAPGTIGRPTAMCHECGFPIEGRFVALAGNSERFHPQCFSCFTCGISLEAMEISPEPELNRSERLQRIRRREAGEVLEEKPGMTEMEDGDDRLRFYCHLDWHEQFAPRCKHCKTPILGEHIVALGEHWHYGHFFCAECGDPFEHGMTHIEKDGYAWCINCQTKRTERRAPKCKMCKTAVIGQYIKALGGEWHEHCFRCAACRGGFDDGQIFPSEAGGRMVVLCTGCRVKELKS
ncbi:LIM domain-containing protein C4F6.12 [Paramyrothecium foliicola]|nr:LIM domain-containing protein C4F6.12 [Paramyrothecium foliicola]